MSELLPCPFCGGEATMDSSGKKYQVWCKRCSCIHMGEFYNTEAEAIAAWNRRAQPENEPLTLEQLREMVDSDECGVHIWVLKTVSRSVVSALTDVTCPDGVVAIWNANATENFKEKDYGQTWLAYRTKPERSEG